MPIGQPNPNTGLIYYSEWMESTHSRIYSRSAELKKIDEALKFAEDCTSSFDSMLRWFSDLSSTRRSESARVALELDKKMRDLSVVQVRNAFNNWTRTYRTANFRDSNRNGGGAVSRLADQLAHLTSKLPPSEHGALAFVEMERNKSIPALFADCKVVAYSDRLTTLSERKTGASLALNLRTVYNDGNAVGMGAPTARQAEGLLREIGARVDSWVHEAFFGHEGGGGGHHIPDFDLQDILDSAVREITDEIAAIVPIAGLATSSASFVLSTTKLVMQSIVADDLVDLERKLEAGDSRSAVGSVKKWQLETIAKTTSKVVRSGVNVAVHAASFASCGLAMPAQLAISAGNAILALAAVIGDMGMQYRRKKALETYLKQPTLGREIFAQSPLAAAYYLLNTPTSHLALQLVRFGAPGWEVDVNRLTRDGELKMVIEQSATVIDQSKYRLRKSDMAKYRETVGTSTMSKIKDSLRGQQVVAT